MRCALKKFFCARERLWERGERGKKEVPAGGGVGVGRGGGVEKHFWSWFALSNQITTFFFFFFLNVVACFPMCLEGFQLTLFVEPFVVFLCLNEY